MRLEPSLDELHKHVLDVLSTPPTLKPWVRTAILFVGGFIIGFVIMWLVMRL